MRYCRDRENAIKYDYPLTEEVIKNIELFDRDAWWFVDITHLTRDQIWDIISDIWANGNEITEEEYNQIISEESKKESWE